MALFLVQHGKSATKDVDPEKGLSQEGKEETLRIAPVAKGYNIAVKKIVHSGKKRALQTAEIYREALGPEIPCEQIDGIAPMDDVENYAETIQLADNCMVVGHLPFMQRLVSYLTTADKNTLVYRFQNSGIVCLDAETNEEGRLNWFIKWTLNPNIN